MYRYFDSIPSGTKVSKKSWSGIDTLAWLELMGFDVRIAEGNYYIIESAPKPWLCYTNSVYTYFCREMGYPVFIQYADPQDPSVSYLLPKELYPEEEAFTPICYTKLEAAEFTRFKKLNGRKIPKVHLGRENARKYFEEECGFTITSEEELLYEINASSEWSILEIGDSGFNQIYKGLRYIFTYFHQGSVSYIDAQRRKD